ncbi:MAG: phosphoenolpyruvate carboxykinase (ATP) [Spirochaetes bacterium]|nr:phosphoenolpyruvate carboxykinase (ATP) [Spirochaetota bacterium]
MERIKKFLKFKNNIIENPSRRFLIHESIQTKRCFLLNCGTLSTITPEHSTGRRPQDTYTVKRDENIDKIDWLSNYNNPIDEKTFDMLLDDAIKILNNKNKLYLLDRFIGADDSYTMKVRVLTDNPLYLVFIDNMFRKNQNLSLSVFNDKDFYLIVVPNDYIDPEKYRGLLKEGKDGKISKIFIGIDYERHCGLIIGSSYMGSMKKLMFTIMNYYTIFEGILPLHCSANEGKNGDVALFLGLSGTGKTTLSTSPERLLIGDDEHGWSDNGIANFENGCYAKLINLNKEKEPDIYNACFSAREPLENGAIVENIMIFPDGSFDLFDSRLTENSRGSYPLSFLKNVKEEAKGYHPSYIIFLTADANGVLPPVSRLNEENLKFWFLMGYTSKLAGTETGIVEPQATFSRFFGAPFMPAKPHYYLNLFIEKVKKYNSKVYLVNTGWYGGQFGVGKRFDINFTRKIIESILSGKIDDAKTIYDSIFKLDVVIDVEGIEDKKLLLPSNTWLDNEAYKKQAFKLAAEFKKYFDKHYLSFKLFEDPSKVCPGY